MASSERKVDKHPEDETWKPSWCGAFSGTGERTSMLGQREMPRSFGISTNVICLKAKLIAKKPGRRTSVAQKLPKDYEDKLINFQRLIISKRKQHNFELRHIGNADQTPLTFDIVTNSTITEKGIKSVPIITTGHDKDRFTVMFACLGDGMKLPPYVVLKCKTLSKKMVFPPGLVVRCQEKDG